MILPPWSSGPKTDTIFGDNMIRQFISQSGGADGPADALRKKILSFPDPKRDTGRVYYVSDHGDDLQNGLSESSPVASCVRVASLPLESGDTVLFERGSVFRLREMLWLKPGVRYGAYGTGEKPVFSGSLRNYADPSCWKKADRENLWVTQIRGEQRASLMVFDGETSFGNWCFTKEEVLEDGDFFHDVSDGSLYFYLTAGNPGTVFEEIEIATTGIAMRASFLDGITVENIAFKYFAQGAFLFGECNDITVTGCVMGWQGGKIFEMRNGQPIRYGNAAEFWYQCRNITVESCYIYQIYDAALTFQGYGDGGPIFENIRFGNNLIEYCSMNLEFWAGLSQDQIPPHIEKITYEGNIIRFCGYGFGGIQRVDKEDQALLLGWDRKYTDLSGFVIRNNILDCSNGFYIYMLGPAQQDGIVLKGNSYYQKAPDGGHAYTDIVRHLGVKAENQADFEAAIALFDQNPETVKWLD